MNPSQPNFFRLVGGQRLLVTMRAKHALSDNGLVSSSLLQSVGGLAKARA